MLRARARAHPGGPVRKKRVRRAKTSGRQVNGVIIGSKSNKVKNVSRKRLQQLMDEQTDMDRQIMLQGQVNKIESRKLPGKNLYISFRIPTPKGIICILMENENTIEKKLPYLTPNFFSQVTPPPSSSHAYVPTITQDKDELPADDNDNFAP